MYDTSLNQKSNSNSNAKIATLKHSSKELERYRISIVFGHSCIAKIISNAHLIRSVQLNFKKNRKLINQIFKCGFMRCFSRCFFFLMLFSLNSQFETERNIVSFYYVEPGTKCFKMFVLFFHLLRQISI